jgi:RNA recognition motif-containing protein
MSAKLYVGGLSWDTTDSTLRQSFEAHGDVQEAIVVTDRYTGKSRGFGFVTFASESSARTAISAMNGSYLDGRSITVSEAQERSRNDSGYPGSSRKNHHSTARRDHRNRC